MRRFLKAMLPILALTGSMLIAQDNPEGRSPEKGQASQNSQRATRGTIVESLNSNYVFVKYVLIDAGNTVYQLDDQITARRFAGKTVKVAGTVDANNMIHVTDMTPAA